MSEQLAAEVRETHISVLFFVGEQVYKLKKPIVMDFIDCSTRERRLQTCQREVELNRRLAPDVYLGVADVLGIDGQPADHLVVMRRMPESRRLATLVRSGQNISECIREVAHRIATFHAQAQTSEAITACGSRDAVRENWDDCIAAMDQFAGRFFEASLVDEIVALAHRYLDGRGPLFEHRMSARKIRDGHGDLLAEDIFCLDDGPRILDCIDFDDRLRYGDIVADVAFLAMDLERLGAPALGTRFLEWYQEFAGEQFPMSLADYFIAARAVIRAKVACLRADQIDDAGHAVMPLLDIARTHLLRGAVKLTLIGGLPGTGKSTIATRLADEMSWTVLRSDELRKDRAGMGHGQHAEHAYGKDLYDAASTAGVYQELLDRARLLLGMGESVVLDASWSDARWRDAAREVAGATHSSLVEFRCDTPIDIAQERIAARLALGNDPSDATAAIATAMAERFDPWPTAVPINTWTLVDDAVTSARRVLR